MQSKENKENQTLKTKQEKNETKEAKLHLASDLLLHKAPTADEFQMKPCTSFAPEENIQENEDLRLIHISCAPKRPCKEWIRLRLIASNHLHHLKVKTTNQKLLFLDFQLARASGCKNQQNQKANLVHECILLQFRRTVKFATTAKLYHHWPEILN